MSKVFFSREISEKKLSELIDVAGIAEVVKKNHLSAIKIHFGEEGNIGYVKPNYARIVAEKIKSLGAKPFLTDANTIYVGSRANAVEHMIVAHKHGFTPDATGGAPVIIADGLRGNSGVDVEVNLKHFKTVSVASAIHYSDSIVFITHFKGHEISGFGGALKNIGMGCATREGKYKQHNSVVPSVKRSDCTGCGACIVWCPGNALKLEDDGFIALDTAKCLGCGECILSCPSEVFKIPWNDAASNVQEKMVEYAYGVVGKKRCLYINFINFVTKFCDCYATKEKPYFDKIGIAVSSDPVSIDSACADIVNEKFGGDFFRFIFPSIDWKVQLDYAESLGLGEKKYSLIEK